MTPLSSDEKQEPGDLQESFDPKVFGIGFPKTATSSLAVAFEELGYSVFGHFAVENEDISKDVDNLTRAKLPHYDAFLDVPWCVLYRRLDQWCPGSKFVLTVRDYDDWIRSITRHFGYRRTPMREWIYGVGDPIGSEDIYVRRHKTHVSEVKEYFSDRPDDLLVLNIVDGEGWDKLCPFLGHPPKGREFPKVNTADERETLKVKLGRLKRMTISHIRNIFGNKTL